MWLRDTNSRPKWWAPQQVSIATTHAGNVRVKLGTFSDRMRRRLTTAPASSSSCFYPRSIPRTAIVIGCWTAAYSVGSEGQAIP